MQFLWITLFSAIKTDAENFSVVKMLKQFSLCILLLNFRHKQMLTFCTTKAVLRMYQIEQLWQKRPLERRNFFQEFKCGFCNLFCLPFHTDEELEASLVCPDFQDKNLSLFCTF